jgi:hypothetical protein
MAPNIDNVVFRLDSQLHSLKKQLKIINFVLSTIASKPPRHAKEFSNWIHHNSSLFNSED